MCRNVGHCSNRNNIVIDTVNSVSWKQKLKVEHKIIEFKIDTGSSVNLIPLDIFGVL